MAAISVREHEFQQLLHQDRPVLVDYWAPWCTYCRRIGPAYDQIARNWADSLTAVKINIDEAPRLAEQEHIEVIPTLVLYRGGKALGSIVVPESRAMIDEFIRQTLAE